MSELYSLMRVVIFSQLLMIYKVDNLTSWEHYLFNLGWAALCLLLMIKCEFYYRTPTNQGELNE